MRKFKGDSEEVIRHKVVALNTGPWWSSGLERQSHGALDISRSRVRICVMPKRFFVSRMRGQELSAHAQMNELIRSRMRTRNLDFRTGVT